jgi:hypothetical protein
MADINLVSPSTNSDLPSRETSMNSGVIIAFVLLVIALAAYGWLYYYNKNLDKKIQDAKYQYKVQIAALTSEKNLETFDFQNRIAIAKKVIVDKGAELEMLADIEKSILPQVYINSLSYDKTGKTVDIKCVADTFNSFVAQVANFKSSQFFSSALTSGASINQDGKWEFELKLNIK